MAAGDQKPKLAPMKTWLLDTGPLVAYLDAKDQAHSAVAACLDAFVGELCTTDAVIVEAMHFVAAAAHGPRLLADFVEASGLRIFASTQPSQLREAAELVQKYADTPMDFADATLVLLADLLSALDIVTLDRRGFSTYRTVRGKTLRRVLDRV